MKIKTLFYIEPKDIADHLQREAELLFVPTAGMNIVIDNIAHEVTDIYWVHDQPQRLEVYLGESNMTAKQLLATGWVLE